MSTDFVLRAADYALTDEQEALREAFSSFFERECPPTRVREAEPSGFDAALWDRLTGMRVVAMGVPEEAGGDGAGLTEMGLVAEQVGRRLAPAPVIEAVVAARLLARTGRPEAQQALESVLGGGPITTLALHPGGGRQLVPAGAVAERALGLVGDELVLLSTSRRPEPAANQGNAPIAWWDLGDETVDRVTLATGTSAVSLFETARREWKVLTAWALVGMATAVLDIGVEHAKSRVAFGAPIGTYQAISHSLVDVAMATETARRLVSKASWYSDQEPDVNGHLVPMAYLYAEETAMKAATVGVHVLGGVGFTVESDAQLYFRRVKGWTLIAGDPTSDLAEVADQLFGPVAAGVR